MTDASPASSDDVSVVEPLIPPVLDELRGQLEGIADIPVQDRPALLEKANEALVSALAQLEEV